MFVDNRTEGNPDPGVPMTARDYWREIKVLIKEFCMESSIHGVKYLVGSKLVLLEKIWWFAVTCLSLYGCGTLIQSVYDKWQQDPVIVTFAQKTAAVYQVPFPAVTICPVTKVKSSELNFTDTYYKVVKNQLSEQTDELRFGKLLAMMQICDFIFYVEFTTEAYDDDCVELLDKMKMPQSETFLSCHWLNRKVNCSQLFRPTLTDKGVCYTFNSMSSKDLLRTEELHNEHEYITEKRPALNWSLETGYLPGSNLNAYPERVLGAGMTAGVTVMLKANISDMDFLCGNTFQGFQVLLHVPDEYPQLMDHHFRVSLNQAVFVTVNPQVILTAGKVKNYSTSRRKCFFESERYLRFFRVYNQKNCELECLTNFTLQRCGCVKFSMPRGPNDRICGLSNRKCYTEAVVELLLLKANLGGTNYKYECNCLPTCVKIRYQSELSQAEFQWKKLLPVAGKLRDQVQGAQLSYLEIFFREDEFIPIVRRELFGTTDLLANCGGLLGLFMGISLLSLVEILYYCSIKPIVMWIKRTKITIVQKVAPASGNIHPYEYNIGRKNLSSGWVGISYK